MQGANSQMVTVRSTRGCGTLAVASHAWVVWLWRRLQSGRKLGGRTKLRVLRWLVGAGGRTEHDQMKFAVFFNYRHPRACISRNRFVRTDTPTQCVPLTTCRRHVGSAVQPDWSISESFSSLVLKTCGPINTARDTSICSPNRRNRAMHDHSSPFSVPSLPNPPLQWLILVFRTWTCPHHRGSFSQRFSGVSAPRPTTRPPTLGRTFSLHGAVADTIATPYVSSMLSLHIHMLSFIFQVRSPVLSAFSRLFRVVPCIWQTSTGFRRVGESNSTALLHLRLYLMLNPWFNNWFSLARAALFQPRSRAHHHSPPAVIVHLHSAVFFADQAIFFL